MTAFAAGERRRARRDDGDRGRHRRPQRDGHARRGRRALRHQPAAPAARPRRARRARGGLPAVRPEDRRAAARARRAHADGFELARIDLELRGEGELAGTRESGLAQFKVARLPEDEPLAEAAKVYAERLLELDPQLAEPEHVLLADALAHVYGAGKLAPLPA